MRFPREATYARQRVRERVRACALAYRRGPKGTFDPYPGIRKIWTKARNTPQPLEREKYSPIRIFGQDSSPERPARALTGASGVSRRGSQVAAGWGIRAKRAGAGHSVLDGSSGCARFGHRVSAAKGATAHDIPLRAEISRFVLRGTSRLVLCIL